MFKEEEEEMARKGSFSQLSQFYQDESGIVKDYRQELEPVHPGKQNSSGIGHI